MEWISVNERLPGLPEYVGDTYIVCTEDGKVLAMEWSHNKWAKTEKGREPRWKWLDRNTPWPVTHWMPLPPPPTTKSAAASTQVEAPEKGDEPC